MTAPFGHTRTPEHECDACGAPSDEDRTCERHRDLLAALMTEIRQTLSDHPAYVPSYFRDRLAQLLAADVARWLWQQDRDQPVTTPGHARAAQGPADPTGLKE